ncbi:hypothetical protein Arub01_29720 [Actinomadura rubrobrunea]|uniref:Uncharacterized protein n=1 Tax=Actinomadura rubrobrunea TaxID=115335 RepID=A0A9W6UW78_9ACTN|nr:hypothetical protein Arub01_29720 [Actinomadura rubrobrunea]
MAACPVRASTVSTSAVAIPSAEIRSSVAAVRCQVRAPRARTLVIVAHLPAAR